MGKTSRGTDALCVQGREPSVGELDVTFTLNGAFEEVTADRRSRFGTRERTHRRTSDADVSGSFLHW